jgi:hypothetical protein
MALILVATFMESIPWSGRDQICALPIAGSILISAALIPIEYETNSGRDFGCSGSYGFLAPLGLKLNQTLEIACAV